MGGILDCEVQCMDWRESRVLVKIIRRISVLDVIASVCSSFTCCQDFESMSILPPTKEIEVWLVLPLR